MGPDIHTFLIRNSFMRYLNWSGQSFTKLLSPLDQDLILYPVHPPQCFNEIISICINVGIIVSTYRITKCNLI